MRETVFGALPWRGALAGGLIAAVGLISLIGSGGGDEGCMFCLPSGRIPVTVSGPAAVQVGDSATFSAFGHGEIVGQWPYTYRWCRSAGGDSPCIEIPGATTRWLEYQGAELADEGTVFIVTATDPDGWVGTAQITLHVSNTPPVVLEDGEFHPGDWTVTAIGPAASSPSLQAAERMSSGGNPGAYLRSGLDKPAGAGAWFMLYLSARASYDPATQGAIYALGSVMDTLPLSPAPASGEPQLWLVVEQGGHWYGQAVAALTGGQAGWGTVASEARLYALTAIPFTDAAGASCGAPGWPCSPDFSATAAPLRFGFGYLLLYGSDAVAATSGIDNWKVTVWRR